MTDAETLALSEAYSKAKAEADETYANKLKWEAALPIALMKRDAALKALTDHLNGQKP